MLRRFLLALGSLFALVGFAVAIDPSLAAVIRFPPLPTVVISALAAGFALAAFIQRRHTEFRDAEDDDARNTLLEASFEPPRPGTDVDAYLREGAGDITRASSSERFSQRIRSLAVQVLVDVRGLSPEDADEQLDAGTWTDDRTAASFFAEDVDPPAQDFVGSIVGADTMYERQAGRVIRELQRITGVDRGEQ